jgi:hypothetical protein
MPMTETLIWEIVRWTVFIALGIFLAVLIYRVLNLLLGAMRGSEANPNPGVWMETNWGGLGGGLSGWRVSNGIIYLVLISFLLGCLMLAVVSLPPQTPQKNKDTNKEGAQGQKSGAGTEGVPHENHESDPNKPEQKSDPSKDGAQTKDTEKRKDDKCAETARKSPRPGSKAKPPASGCTVENKDVNPPSPTLTPTPTAVKQLGQ